MDTCVSTAFRLLTDDCPRVWGCWAPNTVVVDAQTHEVQVWEHLSSLDQHWLNIYHVLGSVLSAVATTARKKLPLLPLAHTRRKLSLAHQKMPRCGCVACGVFIKSILGTESNPRFSQDGRCCWVSLTMVPSLDRSGTYRARC